MRLKGRGVKPNPLWFNPPLNPFGEALRPRFSEPLFTFRVFLSGQTKSN